jgi:hypothetical protein
VAAVHHAVQPQVQMPGGFVVVDADPGPVLVRRTPAYQCEFVAFHAPHSPADFDAWILRTVLNRKARCSARRYLLAEEPRSGILASTIPC